MNVEQTPKFAVVGHPNKGKSSIVATLAQDASVQISMTPGTTVKCREFPMRIDGQVQYVLVDTPGFQRARRALEWMREHETSAAERPAIVRRFVEEHSGGDVFNDECELLSPLIAGAGLLYVVDGSRPYGSEYEAEMEILRWTGQPSMALINMIGDDDFVEEWSNALGQYFRIVRVFDALDAEFSKRLELLRAFGELREQWREPLLRAVESMQTDRAARRVRCARAIADMLIDMCTSTTSKRLAKDADSEPDKEPLARKYRAQIRARERRARDEVERIYDYHAIERDEEAIELLDDNLFTEANWLAFGLSKRQLLATGAAGGAAVGTGVDLAVGGASLLLGAGIGALIGSASAWMSYDRVAETQVLGLPLGGRELRVGPMRNLNFPYVVLGRAILHHALVDARTHAQRGVLSLQDASVQASAQSFSSEQRKALEKQFRELRRLRGEAPDAELGNRLTETVDDIIGGRTLGV